ncbi:DUF998 domain-containing protein [Nonomuraea roseola]|uniref:DUF998 domain-containing protein n=1 Tax=Nonomuraea roseola TaxID=46179 RepID=A0ABV5QD45_9ACTN
MNRVNRNLLLLSGVIGPALFAVVYSITGALRPGYSAWHHTISTLSLGDHGWIQIANFILYGILTLVFATGLRHALRGGPGALWGPILLAVAGLGLIAIGPYVTDPVLGYPTATPAVPSADGTIHNLVSLIVFIVFPAAALVLARRFARDQWRGWAPYSIATGILSIAFVLLFFTAVTAAGGGDGGNSPAGMLERIPTLIIGLWQALLALRLMNQTPATAGAPSLTTR